MRQIVLGGLTLLALLLVAWASQQQRPLVDAGRRSMAVPAAFGPIQPRLSPDGRQIVFSYQGAVWRMPRDSGPMTRLTQGAGFDIEPVWSRDAQLIAYVNSPRMGRGRLAVVHSQSALPVKLPTTVRVAETEECYAKLDFHPDGRVLGNFRVDGQEGGLSLLDLGSGHLQSLARPDLQSRFALSRDGKWLAYTTAMDREGQQWGNDGPQVDIWKVSTTNAKKAKITRFPSRVFDLCWSADDRALFVASDLGGRTTICGTCRSMIPNAAHGESRRVRRTKIAPRSMRRDVGCFTRIIARGLRRSSSGISIARSTRPSSRRRSIFGNQRGRCD